MRKILGLALVLTFVFANVMPSMVFAETGTAEDLIEDLEMLTEQVDDITLELEEDSISDSDLQEIDFGDKQITKSTVLELSPFSDLTDDPTQDTSLQVWYKFDAESVNEANLSTIVKNTGRNTSIGDAVLRNGAMVFNGVGKNAAGGGMMYLTGGSADGQDQEATVNPYLKLPKNVARALGNGDYTISVFVNKTKGSTGGTVFTMANNKNIWNNSAGNRSPFVNIEAYDNTSYKINNYGGTNGWNDNNTRIVTPDPAVSTGDDTWAHILVSYSDTTKYATMYINGELAGETDFTNYHPKNWLYDQGDDSHNFLGKATYTHDGTYLKGGIADFRMYSRALTADEAASIAAERTKYNFGSADDLVAVGQEHKRLDLGDISGIYIDASLPKTGANGTTITWESNFPDVLEIVNNGADYLAVAYPPDYGNQNVILTATIRKGNAVITKTFLATVLQQKDASEIVPLDREEISDFDITVYSETEDEIVYLLPKRGRYGSTVTWGFNNSYNNVYNDAITDFNNSYYVLTVVPSNSEYISRRINVTANISFNDGTSVVTDSVDRKIVVDPALVKNLGGHIFYYKQIGDEDRFKNFEVVHEQIKITGYGNDLWTAPDSLGYLYTKTTDENITISVKIDQATGSNRYRRFGIIFRQGTGQYEKDVMLAIGPASNGSGLTFSSRKGISGGQVTAYQDSTTRDTANPDGFMNTTGPFGIMKLVKKGSYFTAYYSIDRGDTFDKLTNTPVALPFEGEYMVGIFGASNSSDPAYFSQLAINDDDVFASNDITNVKAEPMNEKITVSWTDPTEVGTRTFDKIVVTCTDGHTDEDGRPNGFNEVKVVPKGAGTVTFDNLTNGVEYTIKVQSGKLRNSADPTSTAIEDYRASSQPITLKTVPINVIVLAQDRPKIKMTATSVIVGQKSSVSMSFDTLKPVYRMSLNVNIPSGMQAAVSDVTLAQALLDAGATVSATSSGFNISYNPSGSSVLNLLNIAGFKVSTSSTTNTTITVSGNITYYGADVGEKTTTTSDDSKVTVSVSSNNTNSSKNTGGGAGGGGYSTGASSTTATPVVIDHMEDDGYNSASSDNQSTNSLFLDEETIPDWAKEPVKELTKLGIISGTPTENGYAFNPSGNVTREQFIKMIISAFAEVDDSAICDFTDVSADEWYYSYVATAAKLGITGGTGDGTFGTGRAITRQEMAAMLYRLAESGYVKLAVDTEKSEFGDDSDIEGYAKDAVYAMQQAGIINGYDDGRFAPIDNATRDMAAKVIYNLLQGGAR